MSLTPDETPLKYQRAKRLKTVARRIGPDGRIQRFTTELYLDPPSSSTSMPVPAASTTEERPMPPSEIQHPDIPAPPANDYQDRVACENEAWESSRSGLLEAYYQTLVPRPGEKCLHCGDDVALSKAHIRCRDCAAHAYFCVGACAEMCHSSKQLPFHKPEVWKVDDERYAPCSDSKIVYLVRPDHKCTNGQHIRSGVQVFDAKGRHHTISISVCNCEKTNVTFMRHHLWASSVEDPSIAFHMDLLNWMEFLVLEGKMSLQMICQSLRWTNDLSVSQLNTLYRGIVGEPFEQFRHFKYKLRKIGIESDTVCPACPKVSGKIFLSLDGNFGLVRKMNSGTSVAPPKHGEKLFASDDRVRGLYVDGPEDNTHGRQECSNFQAGTNLRTKNKAARLDVTGVFGSCCRHGVPHTFINMNKGEGLGYSRFILDKLLEQVRGSEVKLHVLYDIACVLESHIKTRRDPSRILDRVSLAVPIFHVYGHKTSCHVKYSTRWLEGYGLTDGEEMERMWAFMRRFAFTTKEMTPSHRLDVLTDGFIHYRRRKVTDIDVTLVRNMEKAHTISKSTEVEIESTAHELRITTRDVDKWITEEKQQHQSNQEREPFSEEEKYVQLLQSMDNIRASCLQCDDEDAAIGFNRQLDRLNTQARKYEEKKNKRRWRKDDRIYKKYERSCEEKKKKQIIQQVHKQAMDYKFIQNLQKKYSDGQAIANRLAKNLLRSSKLMKRSISEYNNCNFKHNSNLPNQVSWKDVCDPLGELFKSAGCSNHTDVDGGIPSAVRSQLMDLRNRFLRAKEEAEITKCEMLEVLKALEGDHKSVTDYLRKNATTMPAGMVLELNVKLSTIRAQYTKCHRVFSKHINTPRMPEHMVSSAAPVSVHLSDQEMELLDMDDPDGDSDDES